MQRLGVDNTATELHQWFTGRFVTDGLDAEGIKTKFVMDQDTRINVKSKADQETIQKLTVQDLSLMVSIG